MEEKELSKKSSTGPEFIGPRERLTPESSVTDPLSDEQQPTSEPEPEVKPKPASTNSKWGRFRHWYGANKKKSIPATVAVVIAVVLIVPFTRYALASLVVSHDISVVVVDAKTNTPVSEAIVSATSGSSGTTSGAGLAILRGVKPGPTKIQITKVHYKNGSLDITIPVLNPKDVYSTKLDPTGRQVKVTLADYINGESLANAEIKVADVKAKTDKSGSAIVVVPVGPHSFPAELGLAGYNNKSVILEVSDTEVKQNDFQLTPTGKVYFLSNRSGRIDVMKANLDGSEQEVALAGTGSERVNGTVLIASADWRYVALQARRDGSKDRVYIINTSDDKLTTADEGNADFNLVGWSGDNLVYSLTRTDLKSWQTGSGKLKSYNAETGKIITLNQTTGTGDVNNNLYEYYSLIFLTQENVVYGKGWTSQTPQEADFTGKQETLSSISANGQNNKVVASYDSATKSVDYAPHSPNSIYVLVRTEQNNQDDFYDYKIGSQPEKITLSLEEFYKGYPAFYPSPDASKTLWSEVRDGKNVLIVGGPEGDGGKTVAELDDHLAYGWFGAKYLLVTKDFSELGAIGINGKAVQKITSYQPESLYFARPSSY